MKLRVTSLIAAGVIAATVLLALVVQIALLGALNVKVTAGEVQLAPVFNAEAVNTADGAVIRLDNSRGAAAVQSKNLSVNAEDALAVAIHTDETTVPQRVGIGWVTLQERRRGPANTNVTAAPRAAPHETVVVLRGHPRWAGNITQMGLGLERPTPTPAATANAAADSGTTTLRNLEFIPANPSGAMRLIANAWFSKSNNVITPPEAANRILPLALWLALISVVSIAATALVTSLAMKRDPARRAAALRACGWGLLVLCVAATVFYARFPGWTGALAAGLCAALALWLIDPPFALPFGLGAQREKSTSTFAVTIGAPLLLAAICAWLSPMVACVLLVAASMLLIARYVSPLWATRAAMLALAPILYVAAVAQNLLSAPALLTPLADPTGTLASVATRASGMPGIVLGAVALNRFWPAVAQAPRWSTGAVAASVWALAAALAVLAIPRLAVQAQGPSTYLALFMPFVTCVLMAVWPRLHSIAETAIETREVEAKTEADLSAQGLALLEGHADVVRNALVSGNTTLARSALRQMSQLAAGARATRSAQLHLALVDNDLRAAHQAAADLATMPDLRNEDYDALLELAHRQGDHARVIELTPNATSSAGAMRFTALAQLMLHGPHAALDVLRSAPGPVQFAQEIAELYLLLDEILATQQALAESGISMNEPTGAAYIARLGMRVQGVEPHQKTVTHLSMWHPQLGAAQAAHGDLLLRQGNRSGARARYSLALKLDGALWPLQYRVAELNKVVG